MTRLRRGFGGLARALVRRQDPSSAAAAPLLRRVDWPERLAAAVAEARDRPFVWGRHDCVLFAADCVAAMTGVDLAAGVRGRYRTPGGAARHLARDWRVGSAEGLATRLLGPAGPARHARRGDVVAVPTKLGPALGVCLGARAAFVSREGLAFVPLAAATASWSIG